MQRELGTFPFGSVVHRVEQRERTPKRIFVLGVYASAVHARWLGPDGSTHVNALAVASEPEIFWRGMDAARVIQAIDVPKSVGRLVPAQRSLNGPSGRSLDSEFLAPLGVERRDAWLCDLVPHACMNEKQRAAVEREYIPSMALAKLPTVTVPPVPKILADDQRRREIVAELVASNANVIVLLGDEPIRWFIRSFDARWSTLGGISAAAYGHLHRASIAGRPYQVLPLAHPRQVSALGAHSPKWRDAHSDWKQRVAPGLLS